MKYGIVILDGAADLPIPQLGNRTPLEVARTPAMDTVAQLGRLGTVKTTPDNWPTSSDVCNMSLLGYDPTVYHTGRAPLEAASLGVPMGPQDWIFRVNFVYVGEEGTPDDGLMIDHSAGGLADAETRVLIADLAAHWKEKEPALAATLKVYPGVSYRNIMVDSSGRTYGAVKTMAPHEMPRQQWDAFLPSGQGAAKASADVLCRLMELSAGFLPDHPVNKARRAAGKRITNMCWIWGQGTRPAMPNFQAKYALPRGGAMTTAVDLLAGIASLIGWEKLDVPGVSSYHHDNDYAGQGRAVCEALDRCDIVCAHVESPDEAGHQGDWKAKVAALEATDAQIVAPLLAKLQASGDAEKGGEGWRMLILPDHYTLCSTRKHDSTPSPFAMAGSYVRAHRTGPYTEKNANDADLHIRNGHELMEFFLNGGRAATRAPAPRAGGTGGR